MIDAGNAFVQNLPLGHYDIATETPSVRRLRIAFDDLALSIWGQRDTATMLRHKQRRHNARYSACRPD